MPLDIRDLTRERSDGKCICGRVVRINGPTPNGASEITLSDGTGQVCVEVTDGSGSVELYDIVEVQLSGWAADRSVYEGRIARMLARPANRMPHVSSLPEFSHWYKHDTILKRAEIISRARRFLADEGFVEVQTPFLQFHPDVSPIYQFITQNRAGQTFYLRVAPEEYLKRLLTIGVPAVFEVSVNIRDEEPDLTHNPEFTSIELYRSYRDTDYMMSLIERLVVHLQASLRSDSTIGWGKLRVNTAPPWRRTPFREFIRSKFGVDIDGDKNWRESLGRLLGCTVTDDAQLLDKALSRAAAECVAPVFVVDFPPALSTTFVVEKGYAKRAELFISGMEIANLGCDIHDIAALKKRYSETLRRKEELGLTPHDIDPCLLESFSYGVPPSVGAGIGIDRIVMLLTGSCSISGAVLFPHVPDGRNGGRGDA